MFLTSHATCGATAGFDVFDIKCCFQTYFNEIVVLDSIAFLSPPRPVLRGMGVTVPLPFPDKLHPAVPVLSGSWASPFPGGASRSLSCRLSFVFKFFPLKLVVVSHPVD